MNQFRFLFMSLLVLVVGTYGCADMEPEEEVVSPRITSVSFESPEVVDELSGAEGVVGIRVEADIEFPARALDPVLLIGDVVLRNYRYVIGGLVFLVDESQLPEPGNVEFAWAHGEEIAEGWSTEFWFNGTSFEGRIAD